MKLETYNNHRNTPYGGTMHILDDGSHVTTKVMKIILYGPDYDEFTPTRLHIQDTYKMPDLNGHSKRYFVLRDCSHVTYAVLAKLWGLKTGGCAQSRLNRMEFDNPRLYSYGHVDRSYQRGKPQNKYGNAAWQALGNERR